MSATATPATQTVSLTIDGIPVTVPKGTLLVEAAKTIKQEIPVYCYHTKLGPAGLCRICLVEIEGMPKLQIACNTAVSDGMVVRTRGDKVDAGRAMVLELFLVNHPLDCPICDKGGECDLQDYAMAYARPNSDVADPKLSKPKAADLGPTIVLDEERCIVCQRCVRFDDIIAQERQLVVKDRGVRDIIATENGRPYRHHFTGNVTELCPVGALTSKTYRFRSRPWDLDRTQTSCTQCSVGCQQYADVRYGTLLRTMLVEDDAISDGWLCDRGRYNIGFYSAPDRLKQPLFRKDGSWTQLGWDDAFALWATAIREAIDRSGPQGVGAIGGGRLLNEEAYALASIFRKLGVSNLDWRAGRQRQATPGRGSGRLESIDNAQAIVIVGASTQDVAPVLWLRIAKAARLAGTRVIQERSAQDAVKAAGDAQRVALVWDGVDPQVGRAFAAAFAGFSDVATYIAGEQPNARGAEAMGMSGGDSGAMFAAARDRKLTVLSLLGVNPVRNAPAAWGAAQALDAAHFVVATDLFPTETTERATLVLPAAGAFEKNGTTMNFAGDLLPVNASLQPPDGVLSDLEMLYGLAQQLAVALPDLDDLHRQVVAAAAAPAANFAFGDERYGSATHGDGEHEQTIMDGGGTWLHDPWIASMRAR